MQKNRESVTGTEVKLEYSSCPFGCPPGDDILFGGCDRLHHLPGEFHVVRCKTCGLLRTEPQPTKETIEFYYPDDYGPYQGTRVTRGVRPSLERKSSRYLIEKVFQFKTACLPVLNAGRMLEIGCASGAFMYHMAQKGWVVEGIEFSAQAAANACALGYPVYAGSLEMAPDPQDTYDLVVGWMVFEHLHNPLLAAQKLYHWVKPGGWLVLSVPNAQSAGFKIFKGAWYDLHLPNHLYHYTPKTLHNVLSRGGWEIMKVHHQRVLYSLFPSMGYVLSDVGLKGSFVSSLINFPINPGREQYLLYPLAYVLATIGQTGRMTVWAKRSR